MKTEILIPYPVEVDVEFPFIRSRLKGEYGFAGFEKTYWKFYSPHKVTVITERMSETTILTYNDRNHNFFRDMVNNSMLVANGEYDRISEKLWTMAVDRLITKVSDGI